MTETRERPAADFRLQGIACALAATIEAGGETTTVVETLANLGISEKDLADAGADELDRLAIRLAIRDAS